MSTNPVVIHTEDVERHYRLGDEVVKALDGVTADIYEGEFLSIMGPSGSGKSTFFNMIGGLDNPTGGKIFLNGQDIAELSERELAYMRCNNMGYIFQTFNLIPVMSATENVALPLIFSGLPVEEAEERAGEVLTRVGLGDRLHHHPLELSGGQQQRVAVARALANSPRVILADEPTGNLDLKTGEEIIGLLHELKVESNVTIISATHDMKMLSHSDRVLWILDGKVDRIMERDELEIQVGTMDGEEVL
ncbi:MAG: ABC transporter ATP-binding protein [Lentisphaerae bacterium]|jgi:putative ABC transport system ATP-binding protein|nr:ABC transporter ATP-binding protein [Lentisphaerota bacterium]MBT4817787.1 ABC transporter ATP-binding protein [Lentisphaerota bacterium]MBT5612790.1 ABC transporter ATP-binding protein [Lentisphaerota bacterium]MBT7057616.1 ABC transporter ATP-binding protein [Lentisphaerota bacterium]MBT7844937.1 ABC transporter ATP-binding protein [Lentisphaerota bacterium]